MSDFSRIILMLLLAACILGTAAKAQVCPSADLNGDCKVDFEDLAIFTTDQWLAEGNGVDMVDFGLFAGDWLAGTGAVTLVINEFMADNDNFFLDAAGEDDDWIEIYNYGTRNINIAGMYLTDDLLIPKRWLVPEGLGNATIVPAGGYLLVWADNDPEQEGLHATFGLSRNGNEDIGLFDANENPVDFIADFGSQMANHSYGRFPDGASSWRIFGSSVETTPTPGKSNSTDSVDDSIIVSEIMYHPYHDYLVYEPENVFAEYIELFNSSQSSVNLEGWNFSKGVDIVFPDVTIASGGYLVVCADKNAFNVLYPEVTNVIGGWIGKLNNKGERIELVNAEGKIIDTVAYYDEGDWGRRELGPIDHNHRGWQWSNAHDGGGRSLELICPSMPNEYGENWAASLVDNGSAGVENSVTLPDIAPFITEVSQDPIIPNSDDVVNVATKVSDGDLTTVNVELHWRKDASVYSKGLYPVYDELTYNIVQMNDEGAGGDKAAEDGIFTALIPANIDGAVVEYFIKITDLKGNKRTYPAEADIDGNLEQVVNLLYQVDDSYDPDSVWDAEDQPVYYLIMTEAERNRIEVIGAGNSYERYSDAQMNATFISVDGTDSKIRYNVGIRNRGESTRMRPPNNYRVNFTRDNPWKSVNAITINSKYTHLQLAGSVIFQMAGLVAAEAKAIQVRVNGANLALTDSIPGRMYGSYVHLEVFDDDLAQKHFPDNAGGNIYKASVYPWAANLSYKGTNPADYTTAGYYKQTNESENDWTDLFELTNILTNEPEETYVQEVSRVVNVDQWIRWFAAGALLGNNETNLGNGYGDDYRMYRGLIDRRFELVIHDLDTILGFGDNPAGYTDSIFRAANPERVPVIERFLKHPVFVRKYYRQLKELSETVFAAENINPLLDNTLGGFVPSSAIQSMKQFAANRNANVLNQIPLEFGITSNLPLVNGYHQTSLNIASLYGTANSIETYSVKVNGQIAEWSVLDGTWTISGVVLDPGINRVIVETTDEASGFGHVLVREHIDIWYNDGNESLIAGQLTTDTTLTSADGPWRITGDITVPAGVTLTIEQGTTLFFNAGTGITVNSGGRIAAHGSPYKRIHLSKVPGGSNWDGIFFNNTLEDNQLTYTDHEYGDSQGMSFNIQYSQVYLNNVTWSGTNKTVLDMHHPSVRLDYCNIPGVGAEPIHGTWIVGDEYLIFNGCTFEHGTGTGDIIDWESSDRDTGARLLFLNNTFLGGGDDGADMDGSDAYFEGNVFTDFHLSGTGTTSNAIAGGEPYSSDPHKSDMVLIRNIFYDNDHCLLLKEDAYATIANNVFVNNTDAAIQFCEIGRSVDGPAKGAYLENNIFWKYVTPLKYLVRQDITTPWPADPAVVINNSIITDESYPGSENLIGSGNMNTDPLFVNGMTDFHLKSYSPAIGAGVNAVDIGRFVPPGASVSGEPKPKTYSTEANLTVGGGAITHYRYRLMDNGQWVNAWSTETDVAVPINLTGLQDGHTYQVSVLGKNTEMLWPGELGGIVPGNPEGNLSQSWTVDTSWSNLVINEVLARNVMIVEHDGTYPDIVELYYDGIVPLSLEGYSITDNIDLPEKYKIGAATVINPGEYLVLYADIANGTSGIHTGFMLDGDGDDLYLFDNNGMLVDKIIFGLQLEDKSIGRVGRDGNWTLTKPTIGLANTPLDLGDHCGVRMNEWLCHGEVSFVNDFIEFYNPHGNPVNIGGLFLSDNPSAMADKFVITDLSFIEGWGFGVLQADSKGGGGHAEFRLSSDNGMIGLFGTEYDEIDKVIYGPQTEDVSQGCSSDGGDTYKFFSIPTPGLTNGAIEVTTEVIDLIAIDDTWSYDQSGIDLGTSWKDPSNSIPDTTWASGSALLYVENSYLPAPKNTPLILGERTYYFRKHFTFNGDLSKLTSLDVASVIDDGAAIYLNGTEVYRLRIAGTVGDGTLQYLDFTTDYVDNAYYEYFSIPADSLVEGDNVIAGEVHQSSTGSSDITFGLELKAILTTVNTEDPYIQSKMVFGNLRITEIMYNPVGDPNSEFIEFKNTGDTAIELDGVRFTSGIDFIFPQMSLGAGEYTVITANKSSFEAKYGAHITVAGEYSRRLSDSGEQVILKLAEPLRAAVLRFTFSDQWEPYTDGQGYSLVTRDALQKRKMWKKSSGWTTGRFYEGTPGRDETETIIINEVLAHSHDTDPDWIELYNAGDSAVDIGGWYLSDSSAELKKYRIADNTVLDSGYYAVFFEDVDFGSPNPLITFALSENGDEVYLSKADNGLLDVYRSKVKFGASATGVPFGVYIRNDGIYDFTAMDSETTGYINSAPKNGPVVISEIMYNPPSGGTYDNKEYEYVELYNSSSTVVGFDRYDPELSVTTGWKFTDGIEFTFPLGITLNPGQRLVVARNVFAFAERYGNITGVQVLGPFENGTSLKNSGERLEISIPGDTDELGVRYFIEIDAVIYDDDIPWPGSADGAGKSLEKTEISSYGNESSSWHGAEPSPGT